MSASTKLNPDDFKNPHIKKFIAKLPKDPKFYYDTNKQLKSVYFASQSCIDIFLEKKLIKSNSTYKYTNYLFYKNKLAATLIFSGHNYKIDDAHKHMIGSKFSTETLNYADIEGWHSFIQWLFPLHEGVGANGTGSNSALSIEEAKLMMSDPTIMRRFYFSYKIMMKFYDLDVNDYTYEVTYTKSGKYNGTSHNDKRISRIIKALDYLGMEHLVVPTILGFFYRGMDEELDSGKQYIGSVIGYGCKFVRNKSDQDELLKVANYIMSH